MKFALENFRCFGARQELAIAPVTILVGENSTGKSSFLAAFSSAWDLWHGEGEPNFNAPPFMLGGFEQIAHYRGGRDGRAKAFTLELEVDATEGASTGPRKLFPEPIRVKGTFVADASQPRLRELTIAARNVMVHVELSASATGGTKISLTGAGGTFSAETRASWRALTPDYALLLLIREADLRRTPEEDGAGRVSREELRVVEDLTRAMRARRGSKPIATAPIRTQPARTYDPARDLPEPGGGHVPMILARVIGGDAAVKGQHLRVGLEKFGKASGLFDKISVKRLGGKRESDPFQIQVTLGGPPSNLIDVGYGVSQVLPIIVDALRGPAGQTYLLQQPEVHLHPRAQAELGSLLVTLSTNDQKRFLVETHSDFLLDRIAMMIKERLVGPDIAAILYFERVKGEVMVHELRFDELGNVLGAPPSYRSFFMIEQERFLFGDSER